MIVLLFSTRGIPAIDVLSVVFVRLKSVAFEPIMGFVADFPDTGAGKAD